MAPSSPREPIHVVMAAAMLQPLVGNNNAYNWLSDMRRSASRFALNNRVSSFPKFYVIKARCITPNLRSIG